MFDDIPSRLNFSLQIEDYLSKEYLNIHLADIQLVKMTLYFEIFLESSHFFTTFDKRKKAWIHLYVSHLMAQRFSLIAVFAAKTLFKQYRPNNYLPYSAGLEGVYIF